MKLDLALTGPCGASGVPQSLAEAKFGLNAGTLAAFGTATIQGGATAITLTGAGPLTLSEQDAGVTRADVKFQGAWGPSALEIGDLRIGLHPSNLPAEAGGIALAVRGRYDRVKGEVLLGPIPGTPPGAIGLSAEGLHISGLGQPSGALKVDGNLLGDLAALDQLRAALSGGTRYDLAGSWTGKVSVQPQADGRLHLAWGIQSPDLTRPGAVGKPRSHEGPLNLFGRAFYQADGAKLDVEELGLATPYASLSAKGQIDDATGRRVANLEGGLFPNWATISTLSPRRSSRGQACKEGRRGRSGSKGRSRGPRSPDPQGARRRARRRPGGRAGVRPEDGRDALRHPLRRRTDGHRPDRDHDE